ncbi:hypothetical protein PENTCL1PPCAC_23248, partial [Pristionchus entomophagus]
KPATFQPDHDRRGGCILTWDELMEKVFYNDDKILLECYIKMLDVRGIMLSSTEKEEDKDSPNSGFIRFDVDEVSTLNREGRCSQEVQVGGVPWELVVSKRDREGEDDLFMALHSTISQSTPWSIHSLFHFVLLGSLCSARSVKKMKPATFQADQDRRGASIMAWNDLMEMKNFIEDDRIRVECYIQVLDMRGITLALLGKKEEELRLHPNALIEFTVHSHLTDQVFIIEGRRIYAGKYFLSFHSPFFRTLLFNSNFSEKNQEAIELKDVSFEEFHEMLKVLYKPERSIKSEFIEALLVLGDQYGIKGIVDRVEDCLISSGRYTTEQKLLMADRYRLIRLESKYKKKERVDEKVDDSVKKLCDNMSKMKLCESSICDIDSMNWITSGRFPLLFQSEGDLLWVDDEVVPLRPFDIGGLLWSLDGKCETVDRCHNSLSFGLIANNDRPSGINWSVEGVVEIKLTIPGHEKCFSSVKKFEFALDNETRKGWTDGFVVHAHAHYLVLARICLSKISGVREIPQFDFTVPSPLSDATLIVGENRLYVNKQYLSIVSNDFRARFDKYSSGMKNEFVLERISRMFGALELDLSVFHQKSRREQNGSISQAGEAIQGPVHRWSNHEISP